METKKNEVKESKPLSKKAMFCYGVFLGGVAGLGIGFLIGDLYGFNTAAPILAKQNIDYIKEVSPEAYKLVLEAIKK